MNKIYKFYSIVLLFVMSLFCVLSVDGTKVEAASYDSYYTNVDTSSGKNLINSLRRITSAGHSVVSYDGLWQAYRTTDKTSDGYVWDMYSNHKYQFGVDQAGNFSKEGDKYNREHSVPKSWFNEDKPMYSDLFHVYPTDGWVNGLRSNYPFGEVDNPSKQPTGNGSKLGPSSFPGYSGTVFEPIDEYKGDFARTYFYMATRYNSDGDNKFDHTSNGQAVFTASYPYLTTYATNLFVKWHLQDPVSEKEINRNDAVQQHQHNRNPYIDHPEYVNLIWGGEYEAPTPTPSTYTVTYSVGSGVTFSYSDNTKYTSGSLISKPNVNPTKTGFEFVGWTANTNTRELWDFNTNKITKNTTLYPLFKASSPDAFTNDVSAVKTQLLANYTPTTTETGEVVATGYKKVTSSSELSAGDKVVLANASLGKALSTTQNTNNRGVADVTISNDLIETVSSSVQVITLESGLSANTFAFNVGTGYLYAASSSKNHLKTQSSIDGNASFKIDIAADGKASIVAQGSNTRNILQYNPNSGSPIVGCYQSSFADGTYMTIYKETSGAGTTTTYEPTDVAIKFNYYVSTDIYNAFVDEYAFAFEYDSSYITDVFFESVTYNGQKCVKVSVIFDNITDYTKTYSVKPVLVKKEDNTQKAYGTQSTSYSVKSLAEYYLNNASNDATVKKYQSLLDYIAD